VQEELDVRPVEKTWHLLPHDAAAIQRLARQADLPEIVAQVLLNRGLDDPARARRFLESSLSGLHAPELLPGATAAAERLWRAVQARRRITVYGDYDVDGVTGTAILLQTLCLLGADADYYVPNRLEEGYGLNSEALRQLAAAGTQLVVTVDCGIASLGEAEEARRLGLELIVTDHHQFKPELPAADAIVHPQIGAVTYPFDGLSGAGVAFKVAWLVGTLASGGPKVEPRLRETLLDAVALAALGLVADVMPLQDENRVLVKHGLHRLAQQPTPGLKALVEAAGLGGKPVRAEDVAFKLAPRLNSAGRLGCARLVVELLTTPSEARARDLATYLEKQNQKRQFTERQVLAAAREQVAGGACADAPALVLASPDWHAGVIGIVAGRLAEQYGRPCLMISVGRETATGSGRSAAGVRLHEALAECGEELLSHGGHAAAAGFRLRPDRIDSFRERFCAATAGRLPAGPAAPRLVLDAEVPLATLTHRLVKHLDALEPYGSGNPRPRFLATDLKLASEPRKIGGGERHLSFRVAQGATILRAVGWGLAERADELTAAGRCCLAFVPRINEWNGYSSVEIEVADVQLGPVPRLG
jgi:single-stranded-DNA-specific exonuclease